MLMQSSLANLIFRPLSLEIHSCKSYSLSYNQHQSHEIFYISPQFLDLSFTSTLTTNSFFPIS